LITKYTVSFSCKLNTIGLIDCKSVTFHLARQKYCGYVRWMHVFLLATLELMSRVIRAISLVLKFLGKDLHVNPNLFN